MIWFFHNSSLLLSNGLVLPILHFIAEYIGQGKLLGGLLFLLPPHFSPEKVDAAVGIDEDFDLLRNKVSELERLLIHANIPVRQTYP